MLQKYKVELILVLDTDFITETPTELLEGLSDFGIFVGVKGSELVTEEQSPAILNPFRPWRKS